MVPQMSSPKLLDQVRTVARLKHYSNQNRAGLRSVDQTYALPIVAAFTEVAIYNGCAAWVKDDSSF
jgi:hypothetical protein